MFLFHPFFCSLGKAKIESDMFLAASKTKIHDNEACVKELVENSLDAKATRIEVRLCESGAELLEVWDSQPGKAGENMGRLIFHVFFLKEGGARFQKHGEENKASFQQG